MPSVFCNVYKLASKRKYDDALRLLEQNVPLSLVSPEGLVLKACLIQLSSGGEPHTLDDARECLEEAVRIRGESLESQLELGMFYLNVAGMPVPALACLRKAQALLQSMSLEVENAIRTATAEIE